MVYALAAVLAIVAAGTAVRRWIRNRKEISVSFHHPIENLGPVQRGDLVDMVGTPYVGAVVCVDGDKAWCRRVDRGVRTNIGLALSMDGPPREWPIDRLVIIDRGYELPAVD